MDSKTKKAKKVEEYEKRHETHSYLHVVEKPNGWLMEEWRSNADDSWVVLNMDWQAETSSNTRWRVPTPLRTYPFFATEESAVAWVAGERERLGSSVMPRQYRVIKTSVVATKTTVIEPTEYRFEKGIEA